MVNNEAKKMDLGREVKARESVVERALELFVAGAGALESAEAVVDGEQVVGERGVVAFGGQFPASSRLGQHARELHAPDRGGLVNDGLHLLVLHRGIEGGFDE